VLRGDAREPSATLKWGGPPQFGARVVLKLKGDSVSGKPRPCSPVPRTNSVTPRHLPRALPKNRIVGGPPGP
jgi:hypothetical protein